MKDIVLENVGKKFMLTHQRNEGTGGFFSSFPGKKTATEFWALRDINIEIEKGERVGIIGRNGAGKTTLLNILAGISSPTIGKVKINGRVTSLLTLGAGFQDELTGRENILLNSSILGMSRSETNQKFRSIVEFSELEGFLDSPLQTYSQGMHLRLGFSVSIHADFEILVIDEILSVGDVSFQKKCFDKFHEFKGQGKTMVIASQSLDIIERLCEKVILLENGSIVEEGDPQRVIGRYLELLKDTSLSETFYHRYGQAKWQVDKRFWGKKEGSKEAQITEVEITNSRGKKTNRFKTQEPAFVKVHFNVDKEIEEPHFGVAIFREDGVYCYGPNTLFDGCRIERIDKGRGFFSIEYKSLPLRKGKYRLSVAIWDKNEVWAYDYHACVYSLEIIGENESGELLELKHQWEPDYWRWINIPKLDNTNALFDLSNQWQRQDEILSSDIEMSAVELLDSKDSIKDIFNTNDDLKIKLQLKFLKEPQDLYLWLGVFRSDDVYCHGAFKKLKEESVILIYPKFPLLSGEYYLSIGVWRRNQKEPAFFKYKAVVFKMFFQGGDHGTVYLEHVFRWELPRKTEELLLEVGHEK
jgi:ABC-type polysaccharide/polyol phosphate transport system ATPase subunit